MNNMVAFDFNSVKNGSYKAVTRLGIPVTVSTIVNGKVIGCIHSNTIPSCRWGLEKWNLNGKKYSNTDHYTDLFMIAC